MKQEKKQTVEPELDSLKTHGRTFKGIVKAARMQKTITVEWDRLFFIKKYERYEKRRSKVKAHVPKNIKVKEGDTVKIMECRPISKTKHFVVIENESN